MTKITQSQNQLLEIISLLPDAVLAVDTSHNLVMSNEEARRLFAGAQPGTSLEELLPGVELETELDHRESHFLSPTRLRNGALSHFTIDRSGAETLELELSAVSVSPNDSGRLLLVLINDVTERVRAEAKLHQAERLQSIGLLAGGIAHDFNNLLGVIINYSEFALDAAEGSQLKEDIAQIRTAADSAAQLTGQLLEFTRQEADRPQVLDVHAELTSLLPMVVRLVSEAVVVDVDLSAKQANVEMNPSHLQQMIMNLSVNARDAMTDGGNLSVRTTNLQIKEGESPWGLEERLPTGDYLVLEVADDGDGMDEHTKDHALEPFFTTKPKGVGTGLGLATVFGAVKQAGGTISLYSEPGSGTVAKIFLPLSSGAVPEIDRDRDPVRGDGECILVAEDQLELRAMIVRTLERAGYRAADFSTADDALAFLEIHPDEVAVLLTDMVMPGMQGAEFIGICRESYPALPIVLMSGYYEYTPNAGLESLPSLRKPFTRSQLLLEIENALETTRRSSTT